ncbi:hypothetical protein B4U37_19185 [Sutcliffiella horikoshii]|uniref:Flagellar protein FliT n=1 Tax=Sutcliffiella horikoshii TaxID=79883 RepID=A0ABM6KNH0_9BACI|nr:hypothetical protein [Sutcliffiella horikoshii]ART78028.1 hypothetical protein B4U37_19185 [Sutcliffiella horikoshii]
MNVVENLDKVTTHLLALLDGPLPAEESRDAFLEEIDKALQIRDSLLQRIAPPFSEAEMSLGKKVALASQQVTPKLEGLHKQLKQEWGQIQQSKKTAKAYGQAYSSPTADGMYYDKRN